MDPGKVQSGGIMTMESRIRILAGALVLTGVALAHFVNPWWLLLPVFVGINLIQSALTGFCPAELVLGKLFREPNSP